MQWPEAKQVGGTGGQDLGRQLDGRCWWKQTEVALSADEGAWGLLHDLGQVTAPLWSQFPTLKIKWGGQWQGGAG